MADAADQHEKARDLTEQALDRLVAGDEPGADTLIRQAKSLDPSALTETLDDLGESDPDPEDEDEEDEAEDDDEEDEAEDDDDLDDADPEDEEEAAA